MPRHVPAECSECGRLLLVPESWAGTPKRDQLRGSGVQRRIVCTGATRSGIVLAHGCYRPERHVLWAGLETDSWALVSDDAEQADG